MPWGQRLNMIIDASPSKVPAYRRRFDERPGAGAVLACWQAQSYQANSGDEAPATTAEVPARQRGKR